MPRLTCRNKVCARLLCLAGKFGFLDDFAGFCSFTVFLEGRAVFALSFLSPVAVSAAVYYYVRSSAFCFVKASCEKILVLLNIFFADRTGSFYSGFAAGKTVRASVDIANLVVDLPVCCENF